MKKLFNYIKGLFIEQELINPIPATEKIKDLSLNEHDLLTWLRHPTTIKMGELLKTLRNQQLNSLVEESDIIKDRSLIIGFCQGYDSIIKLIEETANDPETRTENIAELLDVYLSNVIMRGKNDK